MGNEVRKLMKENEDVLKMQSNVIEFEYKLPATEDITLNICHV